MPDEATQEENVPDVRDVLEAWRLEQLLGAGWTKHRAKRLAVRFDIDLHTALDLLANGCPQKTALEILL